MCRSWCLRKRGKERKTDGASRRVATGAGLTICNGGVTIDEMEQR